MRVSISVLPMGDLSHAERVHTLRPRRSLCRVARVGELLDVVHQAIERPLPIHLRATAQREAIEPLVVAQIREHRLHGRDASAVVRAALGRINPRSHTRRVRLARRGRGAGDPRMKEGDVPHRRRVRRAQTLRAEGTGHAVTLRPAKVLPCIALRHVRAAFAIERFPRGTDAGSRLRIVREVVRGEVCDGRRCLTRRRLIVQRMGQRGVAVLRREAFVAATRVFIGDQRRDLERHELRQVRLAVIARVGREHGVRRAQGLQRRHDGHAPSPCRAPARRR